MVMGDKFVNGLWDRQLMARLGKGKLDPNAMKNGSTVFK